MRSKIMLFEQIRRDSRVEGLSVRALAKRHRVHRRTVRQALASATPPEPARRRWQSRKIDPFVDAIDAMLRSDLTAPRKQRHTAVRVLDRVVDEHQATGLSYFDAAGVCRGAAAGDLGGGRPRGGGGLRAADPPARRGG